MTPSRRGDAALLVGAALLLVASIPSFALIPAGGVLGLDLQNLHAFHHCFARDDPYRATGAACGDIGSRDMFYPPLLYWSFAWLRAFHSLAPAAVAWAGLIGAGMLASLAAWVPRDAWRGGDGAPIALGLGLLLAQFPVLFAMERGNNDVLVVLAWTGTLILLLARRPAGAGCLAAVAAALKLYPVFACAVLFTSLLAPALADRAARPRLLRFCGGAFATGALAIAALPHQTVVYARTVLPRFAAGSSGISHFSHALPPLVPGALGWIVRALLLGGWCVAGARTFQRDPFVILSGALAISTYFAGISYDYNLVTTYPLLLVLLLRARDGRRGAAPLLLVGALAILGSRYLFQGKLAASAHVALQVGWLLATAAWASVARAGEAALPGGVRAVAERQAHAAS